MKKFWIVLVIVAVVMAAALGVMWRLASRLDRGVSVAGGVLHWRVADAYQEERDTSVLGQILHGRRPVMREMVFALERAARDRRIEGLLLEIESLPADWAKVNELCDGVSAVRDAGKPVVAFLTGGGTKEYALAVTADEIVIAPEGHLLVQGISAELSFLKGTLDKLGMQADFVHVGKYKSAPEQLTRQKASPANREMVEAIITDHYDGLVARIAAARGITAEHVRAWIDVGFYDAVDAFATGLADTVLCLEEVKESRFAGAEFSEMADYLWGGRRGKVAAKIALVYVTGTIMPGESRHDRLQGKVAGAVTVCEQLRAARQDDDIDAVILRVDSPGGSAAASDLIWHEMARLGELKPVVVSMSGYAASGGYYVSCGADSLFAEPGTLTGSIGVFAGKVDMEGFYDKIGVQREFITKGENALIFANNAPFTPDQRHRLQTLLDAFYERFLAKVAGGRGLTPEEVAAVAQGRVWTGRQARERGLVDGIGGFSRAVTAAKLLVGIDPEQKAAIISYERQLSFLERMLIRSLNDMGGAAHSTALLSLWGILDGNETLAAVPLLDGRPVVLMPWRIRLH